jgi:P4 family phage/plasmid primase-like protien
MATGLTLKSFLEEHRIVGTADKRVATITGITGGKYSIQDEEYQEFLTLSHDYLFKERGRPLNIIEMPTPSGPKPLLIDLDFRYRKDRSLDHPFDMQNIKSFVEKLTEALNTFFDLNPYETLRFFVCLRPQAYESKGEIKDGIHIECPDIVLSFEKQGVLRRWMLNQDAVNSSFKDTGFINSVTDIYDESCTRKQGWFLYGESKPNIPAYDLKTVLVYTPATDGWSTQPSSEYDTRELMELLSIRYNLVADDNDVKEEVKSLYDRLTNAPAVVQASLPVLDPHSDGPSNVLVQESFEQHQYDVNFEEIELVKQFVRKCLSAERADSYDSWLRVGLCLHSISQSTELFNLWMEFSAKSPKSAGNDVNQLRRRWDTSMRSEGNGRRLTVRSLRHWAKDDNPVAFREILEQDVAEYILHFTSPTHTHVARIMKRVYQDNYAASVNSRHTDWFEFKPSTHKWKKINQGIELKNKISSQGNTLEITDLIRSAKDRFRSSPEFSKMEALVNNNKNIETLNGNLKLLVEKRNALREINKIDESREVDAQISQTEKDVALLTQKQELNRAEVRDKKFSELTELEMKLYNSGFKDSVMKECVGLFYEENFEANLNANPYRIGCANGVIHLDAIKPNPNKPGQMMPMSKDAGDPFNFFQPGAPEDYITFQIGNDSPEHQPIPYIEYDPKDPIQIELDDFFSKLFPRPELKVWVLKLLASCLEGKNREQCYYTFQGVGGNGKSKLVDLMVMTLGDYQSSLQSTALTRKRPESGAANPDIMSIKNKRFIYMQEPDDREPLNTSRMKQFSGEDAVEARALYGDQDRFKVSGKLFMMCNTLPTINSMDRGTWRRIRLIPFESKFVNPDDKDIGKPNVFPRDMNLNAKLKKWRIPFFSRLVHIYLTEYAVNDNGTLEPAPKIVTSESDKYRESFDSFAKFKASRIREDKSSTDTTPLSNFWRAYKYWLESVGGAGKKLSQTELVRRLEDEFGKPGDGKSYAGIFVFNTDEEVEEYTEDQAQIQRLA